MFLSEEERKRNSIKETYDEYRRQLGQMLAGGTITQAEYKIKLSSINASEQQSTLDALLSGITTYEQQRLDVQEKYAARRKSLYEEDGKTLKKGVTQGNVEELDTRETDALSSVDEQFAQREATYQVWLESIANFSLNQLQVALAQAKEELKKAEESGGDSKTLSTAHAKVNKATTKVEQAQAKNDASPGKRTIKEWKELDSTLGEVAEQFGKIGDAVDGAAGAAIKNAGQIASSTLSMISNIITFSTSSIGAIQAASTTATIALKTVEAASVILAVIGAAMQVAMAIASLFNNDKAHQEEIEALQRRIEQLKWELDNAEIGRLKNNNIDILKNMRDTYAETTSEVLRLHATEVARWQQNTFLSTGLAKSLAKAAYQNEILTASAGKLADFYANVGYTADKALGEAKYTEAQDALKNMAQQQILLQRSIDEERAKSKDVDKGQIAKWEQQIQELGAESIEMINTLVEDIIGGSSSDIAKELGNAFFEAFQAGEDAAQAWGDKVDDIVANVMKRMLIQKYLEEPLGAIFDKYKSKWYKDGQFAGIDAVMDSMDGFANDLNGVGDEFKVIWDSLPDNIKDMFKPSDEDREASQKGFASMSQDSADELNGRFTVIQGHTYSISESIKLLQPDVLSIRFMMGEMMGSAARQLMVMQGIEINTQSLVRLERIEFDMGAVKNALDDINVKGIKIRQ